MSHIQVEYVSKDMVRPANKTEGTGTREQLTPWDLPVLQTGYMKMGLFFHKPQLTTTLIKHLMSSFSRTLDYFAPLTGRLATETHEDNTISFYIDCNFAGALFIHATAAHAKLADMIDPPYVPDIFLSFFPLIDVISYEGKFKPLLAVQVTELVDAIFISCSMNHAVADGTSFWHFMNSWSAINRDLDHIPCLPVFERALINDTNYPIRVPSSIQDQFAKTSSPPPLVYQRMFHFTPEKIAQLKLKANKERETDKITSLQALLAHVWITVTRAKCLEPEEVVLLGIAVGNRARLNPPLPEEYFGNSIQVLVAMAKAGDVVESRLGSVAWILNQAVKQHNDTTIRSNWESWMEKPWVFDPSTFPNNSLMISWSPRFDVYGNDFGWGGPVAARSRQSNKCEGEIAVHPGTVKGGIDIELFLSVNTLRAIGEDIHFTEV